MGEFIYSAETGSVISEEALGNPYHRFVDLTGPLFDVPFMNNIITDSHFFQVRMCATPAALRSSPSQRSARRICVGSHAFGLWRCPEHLCFRGRGIQRDRMGRSVTCATSGARCGSRNHSRRRVRRRRARVGMWPSAG